VANTVVVYAYNMWYPCTVYVHIYTLIVHVHAMYIHVLTSCLNKVGRVPLMYDVNPWLWQFGRGKPRLGGLSVEKTGARKAAAQKEWLLRGAETRWRRKADRV
jgi:hypothetical protein